jgi:branched-subunit amino acid ABC-type transport system permease component
LISTAVIGAFVGSIYSLSALGLVLTYRTSGVLNFAQNSMGMLFAFTYFQLAQGGKIRLLVGDYTMKWHLPPIVALLLVLLVLAPATGAALDVVLFRQLRKAGGVVQIVATIGLLISGLGVASVVWGGASPLHPTSIFPHRLWRVSDIAFASEELITLLMVIAVAVALIAFLRWSPLGVRMRAVVNRPELAELMRIDSGRVSSFAWALGFSFAALAGILISPFFGTMQVFPLAFLVVPSIAAAVVGRLESLPLAMLGGLLIGYLQEEVPRHTSGSLGAQLSSAMPFLVLFTVLMLPIRWPVSASEQPPPVQKTAAKTRRQSMRTLLIAASVLLIPPFAFPGLMKSLLGNGWGLTLVGVPALAIIFLSLVVLTGYAGQISLCQAAFAGFGAFIAAHLMIDHGWSLLLAAPVAGLVSIPLGAVVAARATRLPPLFLGLATLAFGSLMDQTINNSRSFTNGFIGYHLPVPALLKSDRVMYLVGLLMFALCALLMANLRRGRTGYALAAMRDSPDGLASLGQSLARTKLVIFCLSAFLAGFGGALFAGSRHIAVATDYPKEISLFFLALAVVGGISRWPGALVGAALFTLPAAIFNQPLFKTHLPFKQMFHGHLPDMLPIFFGLGAIGLAQNPHGVVEQSREGFARFKVRLFGEGPAEEPTDRERDDEVSPRAARADGETSARAVTFAAATLYHLDTCILATGKEGTAVTAAKARKLEPCGICGPPPPPPARSRARVQTDR